jgi:hypothetical protein
VTAPAIRIVHRTLSRTRLRTRGMRGNSAYFWQLRDALEEMQGVRNVQVNPLTESILIEHDVPVDPLLRAAEQRGYLQLDVGPVDEESYLVRIGRALSDGDQRMKQATSGRVDLDTLAFLGMLAGGIFQVARGNGLPAGVTMLRYAVEFVTSAAAGEVARKVAVNNGTSNGK